MKEDKSIRLLLVNNAWPSEDFPFSGAYTSRIADRLKEADADVEVLAMLRRKGTILLWQYLVFFWQILKTDFSKYDVIYLHHYSNLWLPFWLRRNRSMSCWFHWHGEELFPKSMLRKLWSKMMRSTLRSADQHIVPSEYFRNLLTKKWGVPNDRIVVSPSGGVAVNDRVKRDTVKSIGFASAMTKAKGMELVLDLMTKLEEKRFTWHFIKYGNTGKYLPRLIGREDVVLHDPYVHSDMSKFYEQIDLLVFPTLRKAESLGLVALEALGSDVPVVGSNAFAIPEYIQSGVSGELFEKGDIESFAVKVKEVCTNYKSYQPNRVITGRYDRETVVKGYVELIKETITK